MPIRSDPERAEIDALLDYVGSFTGARVLEIGAGDGRLTWRYADQAAHVTGIDTDSEEIALAIANTPPALQGRVEFHPLGLEQFTPAGEAPDFDVVILSWAL